MERQHVRVDRKGGQQVGRSYPLSKPGRKQKGTQRTLSYFPMRKLSGLNTIRHIAFTALGF